MIKNEQQLRSSKEWLQRFEKSVAELDNNESLKVEPTRWKLYRDSYQSQVDELKEQIREYETLVYHDCHTQIVLKLDELNSCWTTSPSTAAVCTSSCKIAAFSTVIPRTDAKIEILSDRYQIPEIAISSQVIFYWAIGLSFYIT